jgi:hypothetical protein
VTDDVFGLEIAVPLKLNRQDDGLLANRQEWRFRNDQSLSFWTFNFLVNQNCCCLIF